MRFLVQITIELPEELRDPDSRRRAELLAAELERGVELRGKGTIEAIWRLPGGLRNVGVWNVSGPEELHEAIASLPLSPWITSEVTALAEHPVDRAHRNRTENR